MINSSLDHISDFTIENRSGSPLGVFFYKQVLTTPSAVAVKYNDLTISYESLNAKANQFASFLISKDIQIGDIIGISFDRSIELVICFLGILKAGGAYIPIDPNLPADRINYMLEDSAAKVLITSKKYQALVPSDINSLCIEDAMAELTKFSLDEPDVEVSGEDLAYILYTSGSTGKPKGVLIEHHSLVNLLLSIQKEPGLSKNDVLLSITTISFDIFELELYLPLITGAMLVLAESNVSKDGRKILDLLKKEHVTVMQATPYTWRMMLESGWDEPLPIKVFCGGEAMTRNLISDLLPKCSSMWNMYGPTETTIYSTITQIQNDTFVITIGKPIDNTQVYILNESLKSQPEGEIGEICIGGYGVARGYLNKSELTEEKFIPDYITNSPGRKIYRTGDLGRFDEYGNIICLGRIDHQIKIRGYRIEVDEIEDNLVQLEAVDKAVVVGHTDEFGNQRLLAYIVQDEITDAISFENHVISWTAKLKAFLPEYMVPHKFIQLKEIPATPNGKVDKKALPEPQFNSKSAHYAPPITETEQLLADIWSKYLHVIDIGRTDNFFSLGGHSIVAVQIMVQLEKRIRRVVPISSLFEHPTIEKLSFLLDNYDSGRTWKSLVGIKSSGTKTPLYIVHGIGLNVLIFRDLVNHLDSDQPVYGLQSRGLDGKAYKLETVEEIASCYVEEIVEQNPNGPYVIAGYSLGGIIAREMVKQLERSGRHVKALLLIDTNLQISYGTDRWSRMLRKITRQFPKLVFLIKSAFKDPVETFNYQKYIFSAKLSETRGNKNHLKAQSVTDGQMNVMDHISESLARAADRYVVEPYNGKIILYRALNRVYFVDDSRYLGWKKYASGGLTVRNVPGDHKEMLLPPNVQQFANILQNDLYKHLNG